MAITQPGSSMSEENLRTCIHCGLCTSACPTYLELGSELDSPRGRISLMRGVAEGTIGWTDEVVHHLDACLGCRACETACPSGVPYAQLLEAARAEIERERRRSWREKFLYGVLRDQLFPYPQRLKLSLLPLRLTGALGKKAARFLSADLGRMVDLLGDPPKNERRFALPEIVPAVGKRRYRVALLTGCIGSVLFARTNWATAQTLAENGCEVLIPRAQGCCGALHLHTGAPETGKAFAGNNVDAFDAADVDAVITNAAGCGAALKEYGLLFANDPQSDKARRLSEKAVDVSAFLAGIDLRPMERPVELSVAYHDACHLSHGQGVRLEPRKMLQQVPGLRLIELSEPDVCCGSAGLYNIAQPDMAERLLTRKVDTVIASGADALAAGNPGCLMHIAKGIRGRGIAMPLYHPIEIVAMAYGKDL